MADASSFLTAVTATGPLLKKEPQETVLRGDDVALGLGSRAIFFSALIFNKRFLASTIS